jgi:hypothetical protein
VQVEKEEGELKRRLVALMEEGNFEYIGTAEKVLDEAKKDFPQKKKGKLTLKDIEPAEKATWAELLQGLEALKWFEKWFGVK